MKSGPRHQFAIRPMRRADAAAVAKMMSKFQAYHGEKSAIKGKDFVVYCFGPRKFGKVWIALLDAKPVGFAAAYDWMKMNFVRPQLCRMLDLLYVEEKHRGAGIGEALVAEVAHDGHDMGVWRMFAGASKNNPVSNRFYKGLGFEKRKIYSNSYMIGGTPMRRLAQKRKT